MDSQYIQQVLYDLALSIAGEPDVENLQRIFLQRMLYHTGFSSAILVQREASMPEGEGRLLAVVGMRGLRPLIGNHFIWPKDLLSGDNALLDKPELPQPMRQGEAKAAHALRLKAGSSLYLFCFSHALPDEPQTLTTLFNPVLGRFARAHELCTLAAENKRQLEEAVQRRTAELQASETRWKFALEGAGDGVWDWNPQTDEAHFSARWKAMLGYAEQEFPNRGSAWVEHLHPEDRGRVVDTIQRYLDGHDEVYEVEFRMRCKDGSWKWILSRGKALEHGEGGVVVRMIGTHTDISERKRIEVALGESEMKFRRLFEDGADPVLLLKEGRFIDCNAATLRLLKYDSKEAFINSSPPSLSPEYQPDGRTSAEKSAEMDAKALHEGFNQFEWVHLRTDGTPVPVEVTLTPITMGGETILHVLWRDITTRKQTEAELQRHREHLEQLVEERTAELVVARDAAEAATVAKSEFLASMSHEIRTPMNAILGMLYLALNLEANIPAQLRSYLDKAQGAAQSLLGIINDILDISKIEAGKLEMESVEFSLDTVVEQLLDTVAWEAEQRGIEFLIRYDSHIGSRLVGDPLRLRQVLLNLCSNAIKFTEEGEVELSFHSSDMTDNGLTLEVCVRDTGVGMDEETQNKLFQKFTQADQSTTRRFGGTGLGLAICKYLVELMGGRIWLKHSQPGLGSTLCCTMQFKLAGETDHQRQRMLEQAGTLLHDVRVLVVDDNEVSREILSGMLGEFNIVASTVGSGQAALSLLEQPAEKPFDVVLMDWRMPGMNGDEVVRRIGADIRIPHKPKIVMVTAYGSEGKMRQAERDGVSGFLVKPVSPSTLLDTTLSILDRGRLQTSSRRERQAAESRLHSLAGAHLLLVEDNEINREFATELLHSMGITVDEALNGEEALTLVQRYDYDGVLMDIQMPVMDGLEATRRIRKLADNEEKAQFAELPIIAMTAMAMAHDADKFRLAGMNDYVTKPVSPERLRKVLTQWIHVANPLPAGGPPPPIVEEADGGDDDLLAMKCFDAQQGIHRIGDNVRAYRKQLYRMREHYADAHRILRERIATDGIVVGEAYCHTLKGLFGNLGATALFACTSEMDKLLKQGEMPSEATFENLALLLAQAIKEIEGLKSSSAAATPAGMSAEALYAGLGELAGLMHRDLAAAEQLMDVLNAGVAAGEYEAAVREIGVCLDEFDTTQAEQKITLLRARMKRS